MFAQQLGREKICLSPQQVHLRSPLCFLLFLSPSSYFRTLTGTAFSSLLNPEKGISVLPERGTSVACSIITAAVKMWSLIFFFSLPLLFCETSFSCNGERVCSVCPAYHHLLVLCSDPIIQIFRIYTATQSGPCIRQPSLGQRCFCPRTAE